MPPGIGFAGHTPAGPAGYRGLATRMPRKVREPRRKVPDKNPEKEARMLTSRITKASSAAELLELEAGK